MKLLDHGYLTLVESWGSDERIVETARMSTDGAFRGWGPHDAGACATCETKPGRCWNCSYAFAEHACHACGGTGRRTKPGDEKLLRYLYEHKHSTPFEFAGLTIEVKAPIVVFREWHRHRTQSYNEQSARYTALPDDNYIPTLDRLMMVNAGTSNRQASGAGTAQLTGCDALSWLADLADVYDHAERVYQRGLAIGVAKELARLPVPVARYSRMRATTDLRNWLGFMTLRSTLKGPGAQWEIRQYADALGGLLTERFPRTMALFSGT